MPELTADTQPVEAGPTTDGLADALEALVGPSRVTTSETPAVVTDADPGGDEPPAPDAAPVSGEPAAAVAAPEPDEDAADVPESIRPLSRKQRGALLAAKDQEIATLRRQNEAAGVLPGKAREVVSEWIGANRAAPDQPPVYDALDLKARSKDGLAYEEQELFAELTERRRIAGPLWTVANEMSWNQIAGEMVDPDYGVDQNVVEKAGGMAAWRKAYRANIEQAVEKRVRAEYDGKIEEQKASYEAKLVAATRSGSRAPVGAGRPVTNGTYTVASARGGDILSDLASGLEEMERERAS